MLRRSSIDSAPTSGVARHCSEVTDDREGKPGVGPSRDNFRSKYFMAINVPSSARLQEQTAALGQNGPGMRIPPSSSGASQQMLETATSL